MGNKQNSFGDFPEEYKQYDSSKVIILPIPFDGTSTWIKGTNRGPDAIISASQALEWFDREVSGEPYRAGIHTLTETTEKSSVNQMVVEVNQVVEQQFINQKFPVIIGGEHSVSIGAIQSAHKHFEDLTVLQIDAHADLRNEYLGSKFNHACVMSRAMELGNVVQVGIRSFDKCEYNRMNLTNVFFAEDIVGKTNWHEKAIEKLSGNIYLTIDLDGFDPSIMPATGTPEPGGLQWYEVLLFLRKVFSKRKIIGFDVVELCPNKTSYPADFLAAKLIYKLIGYNFFL